MLNTGSFLKSILYFVTEPNRLEYNPLVFLIQVLEHFEGHDVTLFGIEQLQRKPNHRTLGNGI